MDSDHLGLRHQLQAAFGQPSAPALDLASIACSGMHHTELPVSRGHTTEHERQCLTP